MPNQIQMPTVGEIARRLHVPVHRVEYLLKSRRREPAAKAGNLRVFAEEDVAWLAVELQRSRRAQGEEVRRA